MNILQHNFQDNPILQTSDDTVIAGKFIPKGYVSATAMCKANGKLWGNYWKSQKAQSFANAVTASVMLNGISVESVIIIQGGEDPTVQGTWVHLKVAMHLAMWISDNFALWATEVLLRVVNGEFKPLTEEAEIAAQKLNKLWDEIRKHSKETRRELTDAIAVYIKRHPEIDDSYVEKIWWKATNKMYQVVFGMNAVELEELLGCERHESRDYLNRKCLMAIDRAESDICDLIDNRDLEPCLAVVEYQSFLGIKPMFPAKKLDIVDVD